MTTKALSVYDLNPAKSGVWGRRNKLQFKFKLVTDDIIYDDHPTHNNLVAYPPNVDKGTVNLSIKLDGGAYEYIVEDGASVAKFNRDTLLVPVAVCCGERGCCGAVSLDNENRFSFVWWPPLTFPDGKKIWLKLELDDRLGNSYSDEWYFTTSTYTYIGEREFRYDGPGDFGIVASTVPVEFDAPIAWSPDNPYSPELRELWIEALDLPEKSYVKIVIDGNSYVLNTTDRIEITKLKVEAGDTIIPRITFISGATSSGLDSLTLRFTGISYPLCGITSCGTTGCGYNGIGKTANLDISIIGYMLDMNATEYFRDIGMEIRRA